MADNSNNPFPSYIELLPKLANYIVGLTLLCYLSGFAIANMYLGSLSTVNLDVLRTRYILVGFLFLVFLGAIAYLIYGLIQTIRRDIKEPTSKLIRNVFWYSLQNLAVLYFAISAITVLAGSVNILPVGLPKISQPTPWSDWLNVVPTRILIASAVILAIIISLVVIVVFIVILINPKDKNGNRTPRKQQVAEIFSGTKENILKPLGAFLVFFIFIFLYLLSASFLNFLTTNNFNNSAQSTDILSGGWGRYLGGISFVYVLFATYLLAIIIPNRSNEDDTDLSFNNPMKRISSRVYLVAITIGIIMPLYANGIYPNLPQQVGGGQVIKVELKISDDEIKSLILNPENDIYLIDRTNNSALFLLININTKKYQVAEIPNSSIQSIIYKPSP